MNTTYVLYREIKRLDTGTPDDRIWLVIDAAIEDAYHISPEDRAPVAEEFLPDELYDRILEVFIEIKEENETQKEMLKEQIEREMENSGR